jgi:hypothetical protein
MMKLRVMHEKELVAHMMKLRVMYEKAYPFEIGP